MRKITLALSHLLLIGCTQFNPGSDGDAAAYSAPPVQSDFDELLDFGVNMAKITDSSRTETCLTLLKRQKKSTEPKLPLQLMVGRLFSDACGNIPNILDWVNSIPPDSNQPDQRMQKFITIYMEALKRLQNIPKKHSTPERKQKKIQSALDSKDATELKKNETHLLREKFEAIRSMEKQLDQSGLSH